VGELVDQRQLRPACGDAVEVHLLQAMALVFDALARDDFEPGEQRLGLLAAMRLDQRGDDIDAFAMLGLCRLQHLIGLADPRRGAEKQLEPAARLASGARRGAMILILPVAHRPGRIVVQRAYRCADIKIP